MPGKKPTASAISAPLPPPSLALPVVLAALLFGVHLFLGRGFINSAAATYDEPVHLASGYSYLKTGVYRLNIMDHPPLAEMWAALPLLWAAPHAFLEHPDYLEGRRYHYADYFLYHNKLSADELLGRARRFAFSTWTSLLAFAVFAWAWRLKGPAGLLGAALAYAFCPALLSNLALVTTDGASTVFFFLAFCLLSLGRGKKVFAAAGLCAGLAMASKFNMVVVPPLALAVLFWEWQLAGPRRPAFPAAGAVLLCAAALAALAAVYRFGQLPLFWRGLNATAERLGEGRSSFFLGSHSTAGRLSYFPVTLAIKMPVAVLVLAAAGLASSLKDGARERLWLWVPAAAYFAAALTSKVQIGLRHVLPVVPFLVLWAGCGAAALWNAGRAGRAAACLLSAWLAATVLRAHPYQLAYFNEAAGGPQAGYRMLTDSNLDWGQDLKGLAREVVALGGPPIYLSYFGTADPAAYGLRYVPVGFISVVDRAGDAVDPAASGKVLFAVSATNLQSTYYADRSAFDWLKSRVPIKRIGCSIFLYDLTADADGRRRLADFLPPGARRGLLLK